MIKALLVSVLFVGLAAAFTETDYQFSFTQWMQKHNRVYTASEFGAKFAAFRANMDFVEMWNSGANQHEVELNQFADITNEEYQRIYLGTRITVPESNVPEITEFLAPQADTVDWRTKGCVTPVKDQGQCGSCWSFSATGSFEAAHFRAAGNLVSFSEQNLMDCSSSYGNAGCNGGLMDSAFKYVIANKGLDTEASYPYTAKDGTTCKYTAANSGGTLKNYTDVKAKSEADLEAAVKNVGPVSIAIDASQNSFQLYKTGVYVDAKCSATRLDHGVLAVGYGSDATGGDYWIVKNSWGPAWGQAGYIWMAKGKNNQCGVATSASYPNA